MRNLWQYPITGDEVINHVMAIADEEREMNEVTLQIGSTRILSLDLLVGFLRSNREALDEYMEKNG